MMMTRRRSVKMITRRNPNQSSILEKPTQLLFQKTSHVMVLLLSIFVSPCGMKKEMDGGRMITVETVGILLMTLALSYFSLELFVMVTADIATCVLEMDLTLSDSQEMSLMTLFLGISVEFVANMLKNSLSMSRKGQCIPDSLVNLDQICNSTVNSTVTLSGVLALAGFSSEVFNIADTSIVSRVLGEFVTGWSETLNVVSTSLDTRSMLLSSRRLSEHTFDITFEVSFNAEKVYGVDGRDFAAVEDLVSTLGDSLASRVASSNFISLLTDAGRVSMASHLTQVRAAELVSLKLEGITYQGVATMEQSNLPNSNSADWGTVTHTQAQYNYTTISLFFGALAVGFFAFVGILSHSMNAYKPISDDSQHPIAYSMPEVMPSEMDQSITGPSRIMGGQVGSGYARSSL